MPQVPYSPLPSVAPTNTQSQAFFTPAAGPDSFGAGIGRGLAQFGESLGNIAERQQTQRIEQQNYDLTSDAIKRGDYWSTRLAEAKKAAAGTNGDGFSAKIQTDFEADRKKVLGSIQNPALRQKWAVQYDQMGSKLRLESYKAEWEIRDATNQTNLKNSFDIGYKSIQDNPENFQPVISQQYALIDALPGLSVETKAQMKKEAYEAALVVLGNRGLKDDPRAVEAAVTGDEKYFRSIRTKESSGNDQARPIDPVTGKPRSSAFGRYQWLTKTWNGLVNSPEGRAVGLTADGRGNPEQEEKAIRLFTNQNANALTRAGITPNHANLYMAHFMGSQGAIDFINAMKRNPQGSAAEAFPDAAQKNPEVFYKMNGKNFVVNEDGNRVPRSFIEVYQNRTANLESSGSNYSGVGRYAELRNLPYEQRRQFESNAALTAQKQDEQFKAQQTQFYTEQANNFRLAAARGEYTMVNLEQSFQAGLIPKASDYIAIKNTIEEFQKGLAAAAHGSAMVAAGRNFDPYNEDNKKGMAAMYKALPDSPNKMRIGIQAGLSTGVMPDAVVSDLRREMLSTNPTVQLNALTLASQILRDYPNAFAGVANKDVVENNALWFNQQLTATGDPKKAQDYVNQRNDPANAQKFKVRDEEAAQFKKELQEKDAAATVQKMLDDSFFLGDIGRALVADPSRAGAEAGPVFRPQFQAGQKGAAIAAYSQFAYEGYQLTGTKDGAKTYAEGKMRQTWGVYEGKIMQYPPSKAYPADPDGNHTYIGVQAAKDIEKTILAETGQIVKIDPSQVIFMPLDNGRTAQDFATRQRPPRYALYYYTDKDGIPDLHMMRQPGSIRQGEWWSYGPDITGDHMSPKLRAREAVVEPPPQDALAKEHFNLQNEMVNLRRKMEGLPPVEPRQAIPKPPQTFEPRPWNQGYDPRADALRDQRNMKANRTGGGPR